MLVSRVIDEPLRVGVTNVTARGHFDASRSPVNIAVAAATVSPSTCYLAHALGDKDALVGTQA